MNVVVVAATTLAVLLGLYLGYDAAGIGGAVFYGALIGVGGAIFGSLLGKTALLLRRSWRVALATAAVAALVGLTWNVDL